MRLDNHSRLADEVIAGHISAKPGQPLDEKQLEKDIGRLYGLETFSSVRYDLRANDQTGLVVSATEKYSGSELSPVRARLLQ